MSSVYGEPSGARRFAEQRMYGLSDAPRGRGLRVGSPMKKSTMWCVRLLMRPAENAAHWSVRPVAEATGNVTVLLSTGICNGVSFAPLISSEKS